MIGPRLSLFLIHVIGGVSVLSSYALWLFALDADGGALWGGVPPSLQPVYTVNMFLAAGGYFAFSYLIFFKWPDEPVAGFDVSIFPLIFVSILFPSTFWLPLTEAYIRVPSLAMWIAIRLTLFLVGGGSAALFALILRVPSAGRVWAKRAALVGVFFFTLQTLILDGIIWPLYFPTAH